MKEALPPQTLFVFCEMCKGYSHTHTQIVIYCQRKNSKESKSPHANKIGLRILKEHCLLLGKETFIHTIVAFYRL